MVAKENARNEIPRMIPRAQKREEEGKEEIGSRQTDT